MSNSVLALIVAVSASAWIYNKLLRTTGNNAKNAAIGAAISGVMIFVVVLIIAGFLPD